MASTAPTAEATLPPTKRRPTVAVIGCGPAGMFFLHAVATRRRMMEEAGDSDGLNLLPVVTCYERAASAGGVWRAERSHEDGSIEDPGAYINAATSLDSTDSLGANNVSTNMYEALWTNGPKECIELFDYTFDDHFGGMPLPTYMPRQPLLEYFLARVTRNNPNFFDDVQFNTTVVNVTYDDAKSKFTIVTKDNGSGEVNIAEYDKCIWACGEAGKPKFPRAIDEMFKEEGFQGKVMHSSQVGDFENDVKNKRILMVGDSFSAEDLALQAIKLGVEKVYIYSRSGLGICNYVSSWPMDKVELIESMLPTDVIQDGRGIRFEEAKYDLKEFEHVLVEKDGETLDIHDISTVIYCTGYTENDDMLDSSLTESPYVEETFEAPRDWKMKPNLLSEVLGDVTPSKSIYFEYGCVFPGEYRCALISNPNLMSISQFSDTPIFEIDVNAWLCLAYITGDAKVPSPEIMKQRNVQQILEEMDIPSRRALMDDNYAVAWDEVDDSHWSHNPKDERSIALESENISFGLRVIAQNMRDAGYPLDIGTFERLNERGEKLLKMNLSDWKHRVCLPTDGPDTAWKTFRDFDPSESVSSIYTGSKAAPLRQRWLDLAEDAYDDLLGKGGNDAE